MGVKNGVSFSHGFFCLSENFLVRVVSGNLFPVHVWEGMQLLVRWDSQFGSGILGIWIFSYWDLRSSCYKNCAGEGSGKRHG